MKRFFLFIFLISFCTFFHGHGQTIIYYDVEEELIDIEEKHLSVWSNISQIEGFRIQLIAASGVNSRNTIEQIFHKFKSSYSEIPAYVSYAEPYFRLRVGDFKTKLEAHKTLLVLRSVYPGAFIVKDQIEFK